MSRGNLPQTDTRNMICLDRTPIGKPLTISMGQMRSFDVIFQIRLLNEIEGLIHKNPSKKNLEVVGSCNFDNVSNVCNVSLGGTTDAQFQSSSELVASCKVSLGAMDEATPEDLQKLLKFVKDNYSRKLTMQITDFLALHIATCFQSTVPDSESCLVDITLVHPMHEFALQPISQLNMADCAFPKQHAGMRPMSGFLKITEGKVVPLMRSKTNISSDPLVGVWIAGVSGVNDVMVWAALLQYTFNQNLQNRICKPPNPFILLIYSCHSPFLNFFECKLARCQPHSSFLIGQANVQLTKNFDKLPNAYVTVRMNHPALGSKKQNLFQSLMNSGQGIFQRHQIPIKEQKDINNADVMPRPIIPSKEREIPLMAQPSVPEMTFLSDDPSPGAKLLKGCTNHNISRTSTPNFHRVISYPDPKSSSSSSQPLNPLHNHLARTSDVHGRADSRQSSGRESVQNLSHGKHVHKMTVATRLAATNQRGIDKQVLNQSRDDSRGFMNSPCQMFNCAEVSPREFIPNKLANCSANKQYNNSPLANEAPHHLPTPNFPETMPHISSDRFLATSEQPLAAFNRRARPSDSYEGINKYNPSTKPVPLAARQVGPRQLGSSTSSPKPFGSADGGFRPSATLDEGSVNSSSMDIKQLIETVMPALKKTLDSCSAMSEGMPSTIINASFDGFSESGSTKVNNMGRIKDERSGSALTQKTYNSHGSIAFSNLSGETICSDGLLSHSSHDVTLDYPSFRSQMEDFSDYSSGNQTDCEGSQEIGSNYQAIYKGVQRLIASISHSESPQNDENSYRNPKPPGKFYPSDEYCGSSRSAEDYSEEEYEYKNDPLDVLRKFLKNIGVNESLDVSKSVRMVGDLTQLFNSLDGEPKPNHPSDKTIHFESFAPNYLKGEGKSKKKKPGRVQSEASAYFNSYENNYIRKGDPPYVKNVQRGIPCKINRTADSNVWNGGQQDLLDAPMKESNVSGQNIGQLHYGTSRPLRTDTRYNRQQVKYHSRPI